MTLNLLSPDDIKKDRSESAEESLKRSRALAQEESRLAKAINQARADAEAEIERIEADYQAYKADKEAERIELNREIGSLRAEREELLKPIDEIKATANRTLAEATDRLRDVENKEARVEADRQKIVALAEDLADRKDELDTKAESLKKRERAVEEEEARVKLSQNTLAGEWVKFHVSVEEFNRKVKNLDSRERQLNADAKMNQIKQVEIQREWRIIGRERIAIKARYEELSRARKQIYGH